MLFECTTILAGSVLNIYTIEERDVAVSIPTGTGERLTSQLRTRNNSTSDRV
jgi:hypothetical protein